MDWKWVSIVFFFVALVCLPIWPYSANWRFYPSAFCVFVGILTLLVSIFAKRGSAIWKHKGQG